ncbi:MAG: hypothetical protein J6N70_14710 [Oribacterium sp.]|nr:hypothetical protein [Oribacterium sp.]
MSLTFEKVDDILTEKAIDIMDRNFERYRDQIKDTAMDLTHIAQDYDLSENVRMFDDITAISFALDAMYDTLREYQVSYTTLLEKYNELVKAE